MDKKYESLRLQNQLCFPLYAASREVVKLYTPFLDEIDLTYTQYVAMMVMWEEKEISAKELGERLYLDSGTITPVLKALEKKGYVSRARSKEDERLLLVTLTEKGLELQDKALEIPGKIGECIHITAKEAESLYQILYKILGRN